MPNLLSLHIEIYSIDQSLIDFLNKCHLVQIHINYNIEFAFPMYNSKHILCDLKPRSTLKSIKLININTISYRSNIHMNHQISDFIKNNINILECIISHSNSYHNNFYLERNRWLNWINIQYYIIDTIITLFNGKNPLFPPYVLLEIIDWLPYTHSSNIEECRYCDISKTGFKSCICEVNHLKKIRLIEGVYKTIKTFDKKTIIV